MRIQFLDLLYGITHLAGQNLQQEYAALTAQGHELARLFESKKITADEYDSRINELNQKAEALTDSASATSDFKSLISALKDNSHTDEYKKVEKEISYLIDQVNATERAMAANKIHQIQTTGSISHLLPKITPRSVLYGFMGLSMREYDKQIAHIKDRLQTLGGQEQQKRHALASELHNLSTKRDKLERLQNRFEQNASGANIMSKLLSTAAFCASRAAPTGPHAMAAAAAIMMAKFGVDALVGEKSAKNIERFNVLQAEISGMMERAGLMQQSLQNNQMQQGGQYSNWGALCSSYGTLYDVMDYEQSKNDDRVKDKAELEKERNRLKEAKEKAWKKYNKSKIDSKAEAKAWQEYQSAIFLMRDVDETLAELDKEIEKWEKEKPNSKQLQQMKDNKACLTAMQELWISGLDEQQQRDRKTLIERRNMLLEGQTPLYAAVRQAEAAASMWIQYYRITESKDIESMQQKMQLFSVLMSAFDSSFELLVGIEGYFDHRETKFMTEFYNKLASIQKSGIESIMNKLDKQSALHNALSIFLENDGIVGANAKLILPLLSVVTQVMMAAHMFNCFRQGKPIPQLDPVLNAIDGLKAQLLQCTKMLSKQVKQVAEQQERHQNELLVQFDLLSNMMLTMANRTYEKMDELSFELVQQMRQGFAEVKEEIYGLKFYQGDMTLRHLQADLVKVNRDTRRYYECKDSTVYQEELSIEKAVSAITSTVHAWSNDKNLTGRQLANSSEAEKKSYLLKYPGWRSMGLVITEFNKIKPTFTDINSYILAPLVLWGVHELVFLCEALKKHGQQSVVKREWLKHEQHDLLEQIEIILNWVHRFSDNDFWWQLAQAYKRTTDAISTRDSEIEKHISQGASQSSTGEAEKQENYLGRTNALIRYRNQPLEQLLLQDEQEQVRHAISVANEEAKYCHVKDYKETRSTFKWHGLPPFSDTVEHLTEDFPRLTRSRPISEHFDDILTFDFPVRAFSMAEDLRGLVVKGIGVAMSPLLYPIDVLKDFPVGFNRKISQYQNVAVIYRENKEKRLKDFVTAYATTLNNVTNKIQSEENILYAVTDAYPVMITCHQLSSIDNQLFEYHQKGLVSVWGEWSLISENDEYHLVIKWYFEGKHAKQIQHHSTEYILQIDQLTYDYFHAASDSGTSKYVLNDMVQRFYFGSKEDAAFGVPNHFSCYQDSSSGAKDDRKLFPVEEEFSGLETILRYMPGYRFKFESAHYDISMRGLLFALKIGLEGQIDAVRKYLHHNFTTDDIEDLVKIIDAIKCGESSITTILAGIESKFLKRLFNRFVPTTKTINPDAAEAIAKEDKLDKIKRENSIKQIKAKDEVLNTNQNKLETLKMMLRSMIHLFVDNPDMVTSFLEKLITAINQQDETQRKKAVLDVKKEITSRTCSVVTQLSIFKKTLTAAPTDIKMSEVDINTLFFNNRTSRASAANQATTAGGRTPKTKLERAGFSRAAIANEDTNREPFFVVMTEGLKKIMPNEHGDAFSPTALRSKCIELCHMLNDPGRAQRIYYGRDYSNAERRYDGTPKEEGRLLCDAFAINIHLIIKNEDGKVSHCMISREGVQVEQPFNFNNITYKGNVVHMLQEKTAEGRLSYQLLEHISQHQVRHTAQHGM